MGSHKAILVAVAAAVASFSACSGSDAAREERLADLRSERRSLLVQFSAAQLPIRRLQAQALDEPGVRSAQEVFYVEFRAAVLREDPDAIELLERARAVGHDLDFMQSPVLLSPEQEDPRPVAPNQPAEVVRELAEVERALRPVIGRALQDPAVWEAFDALRDSIIASILRIDPESERAMNLMADIEGQVARIDAEIASLSQ
jgi:hypothetical protein